jgi:hypothetical protein
MQISLGPNMPAPALISHRWNGRRNELDRLLGPNWPERRIWNCVRSTRPSQFGLLFVRRTCTLSAKQKALGVGLYVKTAGAVWHSIAYRVGISRLRWVGLRAFRPFVP